LREFYKIKKEFKYPGNNKIIDIQSSKLNFTITKLAHEIEGILSMKNDDTQALRPYFPLLLEDDLPNQIVLNNNDSKPRYVLIIALIELINSINSPNLFHILFFIFFDIFFCFFLFYRRSKGNNRITLGYHFNSQVFIFSL